MIRPTLKYLQNILNRLGRSFDHVFSSVRHDMFRHIASCEHLTFCHIVRQCTLHCARPDQGVRILGHVGLACVVVAGTRARSLKLLRRGPVANVGGVRVVRVVTGWKVISQQALVRPDHSCTLPILRGGIQSSHDSFLDLEEVCAEDHFPAPKGFLGAFLDGLARLWVFDNDLEALLVGLECALTGLFGREPEHSIEKTFDIPDVWGLKEPAVHARLIDETVAGESRYAVFLAYFAKPW